MVLNEGSSSKPQRGIVKRTLIYVLGFGLGSLGIASCLSFAMMSVADGVMPSDTAKPAATTAPKIIGATDGAGAKSKPKLSPRKPASKARRGRANQGATKSSDQPL
jgi:hypothetical protein